MNIKIEYDYDINQVFISNNNKSIPIDRTEVARIETILEALEIPFAEKLGEVFLFDDEIILTDKNNITSDGKKFPETPRPEVVYGGIFPTKEMVIKKVKQWLQQWKILLKATE